jgi:RHS repeat-associated protein
VSFEYDALGRRTAKLFQDQITRWVWDGNKPLHEWTYQTKDRPQAVVDEWGRISKDQEEPVDNLITWVFEEGTFKPAAKLIKGKAYSIITDYLGTPKEAYDWWANKVWAIELEAYGKVKSCEGWLGTPADESFIPFRFQGQYHDVETGLYYNRFRYYSPEEGMYVTAQDPIGLVGVILIFMHM